MFITNPEAFADLFNAKVPGAYRKVTVNDIRLMTKCGLIGRYSCYDRQDLETVRGVLQYEQSRDNQSMDSAEEKNPSLCKRCGQPLTSKPEGKPGRRHEYCAGCETFRNKERQKRLRLRLKKQHS